MNNLYKFLVFTFLFSLGNVNAATISLDPPVLIKILEKDFPLFRDSDEKIVYIDFELLTTNVQKIQILDENGFLKFQDDVSKNKVDSIYEIDYSTFEAGIYKLELHTYLGNILNAEISIQ